MYGLCDDKGDSMNIYDLLEHGFIYGKSKIGEIKEWIVPIIWEKIISKIADVNEWETE